MKKRVFYLDLIRFVAVFAVLGCHFTRQLEYGGVGFTAKVLPDFIFNVYMGSYGVGLFFIVSGASLMLVYSEKLELKKFYAKRFWAIYPMFWLAYILAFLYRYSQVKTISSPHPIWTYLLTLVGMDGYLGFYVGNYYILGEWFLGCLIILYLLFPILRMGVKKYPIITAVISWMLFAAGSFYSFKHGYRMPPECWFFMRIPEMLFGMYFMEYIKDVKWYAVPLAVVFLGAMQWLPIYSQGNVQILKTVPVCIASFIVLVFVAKYIAFYQLEEVCKLVGKYSYAIFLCHHFILQNLAPKWGGLILGRMEVYALFALALVIIATISKLLFLLNNSFSAWLRGRAK